MFKRKTPRTYGQMASEMVYPPGGFRRSAAYLWHRLRRLPDQPQRIARGLAAGVFLSFSPLHGFHFMVAALVSLAIRGNVLAAFLGTFVGNPLTTPFIALGAVGLGRTILGQPGDMSPQVIFREFAHATAETWRNVMAVFGPGPTSWSGLSEFWHGIFVPYAVGGAVLGGVAAVIVYYLTIPVVRRYHRRKSLLMARRIARIQNETRRDATDAGDT